MDKAQYDERINALKVKYEPKIKAALQAIADSLIAKGYKLWRDSETGEVVYDYSDEEYGWGINQPDPMTPGNAFGIELYMTEEREREGGEGTGISFLLSGAKETGELLYSFAPGNYTPHVWVDMNDDDDVEGRWQEMVTALQSEDFPSSLMKNGVYPQTPLAPLLGGHYGQKLREYLQALADGSHNPAYLMEAYLKSSGKCRVALVQAVANMDIYPLVAADVLEQAYDQYINSPKGVTMEVPLPTLEHLETTMPGITEWFNGK